MHYLCSIRERRQTRQQAARQSAGALLAVSVGLDRRQRILRLGCKAARWRGVNNRRWQACITVIGVDHNAVNSDRSNPLLLGRSMKWRKTVMSRCFAGPISGGRRNFWRYRAIPPAEVYFAPLPTSVAPIELLSGGDRRSANDVRECDFAPWLAWWLRSREAFDHERSTAQPWSEAGTECARTRGRNRFASPKGMVARLRGLITGRLRDSCALLHPGCAMVALVAGSMVARWLQGAVRNHVFRVGCAAFPAIAALVMSAMKSPPRSRCEGRRRVPGGIWRKGSGHCAPLPRGR